MNKNVIFSVGMTVVILNVLFLLGIMKAIFGEYGNLSTNLFNTGITSGAIIGIANIFLVWWLHKKYI